MWEYRKLVEKVLSSGTRKENRTGVDTISYFNLNYEHDLADGFPLLTTKEINFKHIVMEVLWYISGATNIGFLQRHGCYFWDPWADQNGEVPSAYGYFWRRFPVKRYNPLAMSDSPEEFWNTNDQLSWVIEELKKNPLSRRLVVTAWEPDNAQTSKLPPCHPFFVFNVQEGHDGVRRLNLHLTQRSCDIALGLPYNLAGYSLLLHLVARFVGMKPGRFAHSLIDAHIYTCKPDGSMAEYDHVPGLVEQINREYDHSPILTISDEIQCLEDVMALLDVTVTSEEIMSKFQLSGYRPKPAIRFKVAV